MSVLIVTYSEDNDVVQRVTRHLERLGERAIRLDTDRLPGAVRLTVRQPARTGLGREEVLLTTPEGTFDLREVTAVWFRRVRDAAPPDPDDLETHRACLEETKAVLFGVLARLPVFQLDTHDTMRRAGHKQVQHAVALEEGFEIPPTLITSDPAAVRQFAAEHPRLVAKMLSAFALLRDGRPHAVHTSAVKPEDLDDLDGLRRSPMVFQAEVPKEVEIRATVVGDRVFAASIDVKQVPSAQVDWRRNAEGLARSFRPFELPTEVAERLVRVARRLGLNYGAADVVLTPDGRYVFLEMNPGGEFHWIEVVCGHDISGAIAELLAGRVTRHPSPINVFSQGFA